MCAPASPRILEEFHSNNRLDSTILVSVWELGSRWPSFCWPSLRLVWKTPGLSRCNLLFIIFAIVAAESQNINMLIALRFLLRLTVASTTLNPCIVGDMFKQDERGRAIAIMGMTPFIAPILGPILGGFISQAKGWRWTFWLIAIMAGAFDFGLIFFFRETYKPSILAKKARRLQKQTGDYRFRTQYHSNTSAATRLGRTAFRPMKLLFTSFVIVLVSICGAFASSYTYVVITSLTEVFEQNYEFPENLVGLAFLGLGTSSHNVLSFATDAKKIAGFGMIVSVVVSGVYLDAHLKSKSVSQPPKAEHRLPPMAVGHILVPLGLILFGWTAQKRIRFVVPIGSTMFVGFGFGFVAVFLASQSYLVDAFGIYAASATAATVTVRNVASAALPLAGPPLFQKLGLGLGTTVLGLVALAFSPVPFVLMRYGDRMRQNKKSLATLV